MKVILLIVLSIVVCGSNRVHKLPNLGYVGDVVQYSGYLNIDSSTSSNIFYYFFESQTSPSTAPVTLWLQGGPGASSMMGLFLENGPYVMSASGSLSNNPYSWNSISNILYIDQPLGTGYSYTNNTNAYPTNETEVSADIYAALQLFFGKYSKYQNLPFYVTGESYGGKYIPSVSTYISQQNQLINQKKSNNTFINLQGLAIGNGWVHPIIQNQAYVDYPYNLGLISSYQRDQAQLIMNDLSDAILDQNWLLANNLSNALEAYVVQAAGNIDEDNILYSSDPLGPAFTALNTYLNTPVVQQTLGVAGHNWSFENVDAYNALNPDEQRSVLGLLPDLIANYRVLIYTGNMDLNCNVLGVDNYLNAMNWTGSADFYTAPRVNWFVDNSLAGYARSYGNLTNVVVRNAGHEVPFFQPQNALDLFNRFITNKPFGN